MFAGGRDKDRDKPGQAVCVFANDLPDHGAPGGFFVCANDDGSRAHAAITDEFPRALSDVRTDGTVIPLPSVRVEKRTLAGGLVAVGAGAGAAIRCASRPPQRPDVDSRRAAPGHRHARGGAAPGREARGTDLPFDLWPVRGAGLTGLDLDLLRPRVSCPRTWMPGVLAANRAQRGSAASGGTVRRAAATYRSDGPGHAGCRHRAAGLRAGCVHSLSARGRNRAHRYNSGPERDRLPRPDALRLLDELFQGHTFVATDVVRQATDVPACRLSAASLAATGPERRDAPHV